MSEPTNDEHDLVSRRGSARFTFGGLAFLFSAPWVTKVLSLPNFLAEFLAEGGVDLGVDQLARLAYPPPDEADLVGELDRIRRQLEGMANGVDREFALRVLEWIEDPEQRPAPDDLPEALRALSVLGDRRLTNRLHELELVMARGSGAAREVLERVLPTKDRVRLAGLHYVAGLRVREVSSESALEEEWEPTDAELGVGSFMERVSGVTREVFAEVDALERELFGGVGVLRSRARQASLALMIRDAHPGEAAVASVVGLLDEAEGLARTQGPRAQACVERERAWVAAIQGDLHGARGHLDRAQELAGREQVQAGATSWGLEADLAEARAILAYVSGETEAEERAWEEAVALERQPFRRVLLLFELGKTRQARGKDRSGLWRQVEDLEPSLTFTELRIALRSLAGEMIDDGDDRAYDVLEKLVWIHQPATVPDSTHLQLRFGTWVEWECDPRAGRIAEAFERHHYGEASATTLRALAADALDRGDEDGAVELIDQAIMTTPDSVQSGLRQELAVIRDGEHADLSGLWLKIVSRSSHADALVPPDGWLPG